MKTDQERLELTKWIRLTGETHQILKEQKITQEKSMARILNDLIQERYNPLTNG